MQKSNSESANERQKAILTYWFGELKEDESLVFEYNQKWFGKDMETDEHIRMSFEHDLMLASEGMLDSWKETPQGTLALIILVDQFPRNMYRGTPKAFATDALAAETCLNGLEKGFDEKLHPVERFFFYMPLQHSEKLDIQKKSLHYFSLLEDLCSDIPSLATMSFKKYADMHYVIIERFGRFPHRNEILGRKSTPEEIEFLKQPGSSF